MKGTFCLLICFILPGHHELLMKSSRLALQKPRSSHDPRPPAAKLPASKAAAVIAVAAKVGLFCLRLKVGEATQGVERTERSVPGLLLPRPAVKLLIAAKRFRPASRLLQGETASCVEVYPLVPQSIYPLSKQRQAAVLSLS
jgi:hypothetical protein